jgi:hypothetical protein
VQLTPTDHQVIEDPHHGVAQRLRIIQGRSLLPLYAVRNSNLVTVVRLGTQLAAGPCSAISPIQA